MNESKYPNTNHWKRKILFANGIPLALHDHRNTTNIIGAVTVENGQLLRANVADVDFIQQLNTLDQNPVTNPEHAIIHITGNRIDFVTACYPCNDAYKGIILQATTQVSLNESHEATENVVWLSMADRTAYTKVSEWLSEFLALDFVTAKSIAEAEDRWSLKPEIQKKYEKLLDITHPGDPAATLAFHLLCEAWHEVNVVGNKELSGFPIAAPSNLDDWLAPFSPEKADDPIRIASVVAKMGDNDTKTKVKNVLDTAKGGQSPKDYVIALLGIEDNSTTQSKGVNQ